MSFYYSTPPGQPPIEYLFVDGGSMRGYLANISTKYFNGESFDIDFTRMDTTYTKVFFYDAIPVKHVNETDAEYQAKLAPQEELLARLRSTDRVHVYEGDARKRRKGGGLEQKMVDVMLAVDMLTHSFRRNMQRATLFTGDQDFKPLVDALVGEGMFVTLWYPPGETNSELISSADRRRPFKLWELQALMTPLSKERFILPAIANFDPKIEPGNKMAEWDEDERGYGIYRDDGDWVITRTGDASNRLHLRHSSWGLLRAFASDHDIVLPPAFENYGIDNA